MGMLARQFLDSLDLEADDRYFNDAGEMDFEQAEPLSVMLGREGMWFT